MKLPKQRNPVKEYVAPEDKPLTSREQEFVGAYIKTNNARKAWKELGWDEGLSDAQVSNRANSMLYKPNVQLEIFRIMDELRNKAVASSSEVMAYFTSVMRGEVKDQFGLDAPLAERTRAAQELAKRTVDIENRAAGQPDQTIAIRLDWTRN